MTSKVKFDTQHQNLKCDNFDINMRPPIGSCTNQLFAWTLAVTIHLRCVIKRLILTCRRRDESLSLLLQVNKPFYESLQMYRISQSSFKELIWARPYWMNVNEMKSNPTWACLDSKRDMRTPSFESFEMSPYLICL